MKKEMKHKWYEKEKNKNIYGKHGKGTGNLKIFINKYERFIIIENKYNIKKIQGYKKWNITKKKI